MNEELEEDQSQGFSMEPRIQVCGVTNENWRGKNDPTERRRIQNRLNQRAFRQRQRSGDSPKQYTPRSRSGSAKANSPGDEPGARSPEAEEEELDEEPPTFTCAGGSPSGRAVDSSANITDYSTGRVWDELAQTINRNLMSAACANAQKLGISTSALQNGHPILTPTSRGGMVPTTLQPVQAQHQAAHDPIIDIIPHARLRYNILRAIAAHQLDAAKFSHCLRASGALENIEGRMYRCGLIVWSTPDQLPSWEISEHFVRKYASLLQGCEDLLDATNAWRRRRGERLFPTTFNRR